MLRTNTKKYQENFKNYFLEVIKSQDLPEDIKTDKEKVNFIFERFNSEYNHANNIRRQPNFQLRFAEWLQGLAINLPYNYNDIIDYVQRVKKGTDQSVYNYLLQIKDIDVYTNMPPSLMLTHLNRFDWFSHNWQLNED